MMKKCNSCNVYISDESDVCPLCRHGLTEVDDLKIKKQAVYPDIVFSRRKFNSLINIFKLISLILIVLSVCINAITYSETWWSVIVVAAVVYFWVTMKYSILHNTNYAAKILVQIILTMLLSVLIDFVLGYSGWSVNYALPSIALLGCAAIAILMVVNYMNWQSYIMFQIAFVAFGIIFVILYANRIITKPLMTYMALGISLLMFICTIIFGDKKAKTELKRRFHM